MLQSPELLSITPFLPFFTYVLGDVTLFSTACSASLLDQLVQFNPSQLSHTSDWIVPIDRVSSQEAMVLSQTPEHFVDDVAEMLLFVAKYSYIDFILIKFCRCDVSYLSIRPLHKVLDLLLYLVRWVISKNIIDFPKSTNRRGFTSSTSEIRPSKHASFRVV